MLWRRLNIPEIDLALQAVAAGQGVEAARAPGQSPVRDALHYLAEGYRYVDRLLAERTEIFAYGGTDHIVELNHVVLCGAADERRAQFADHIAETEQRFFDRPGEGIGELFDWYQRNRTRAPRALAAGIVVQVISRPQLFIEGNRRTATLLGTYVLARGGLPPLVATAATLPRWRDIAERCSALDRTGFASAVAVTIATHRVAELLPGLCDPRFLQEQVRAERD